MNKLVKIILIFTVLFTTVSVAPQAGAQLSITRTEITDIKDGKATLKWRTSEPTKGTIYYGLDINDLEHKLRYSVFSYSHELLLQGLEKNKTYYYKIITEARNGEQTEAFIQNFSTRYMADTIKPKFTYKRVEQVTSNAVAIAWATNEPTKVIITYGLEYGDHTPKTTGTRWLRQYEKMYIYNLIPQQDYFLELKIIDEGNNSWKHTFYFATTKGVVDGSDFRIYNVQPQSFNASLITPTTAKLSWGTTLVAKSTLSIRPEGQRYPNRISVEDGKYSQLQKITLTDLQPNTTYYYSIRADDSLYRKWTQSAEYSFRTPPVQQVLGVKVEADETDTDNDGLSDSMEIAYGTDPNDNDTDNDGYYDGLEVDNNYNPKGYGRSAAQVYTDQSILNSFENNKSSELKLLVEQKIGKFNIGFRDWFVLSNAYTHGGYSTVDVAKAIEHSGKTVHPTIPWRAWKNTQEYIEYISK